MFYYTCDEDIADLISIMNYCQVRCACRSRRTACDRWGLMSPECQRFLSCLTVLRETRSRAALAPSAATSSSRTRATGRGN